MMSTISVLPEDPRVAMIEYMYVSNNWTVVPEELKASSCHEINMIALHALAHIMATDHDSFGDIDYINKLVRLTKHIKQFLYHPNDLRDSFVVSPAFDTKAEA